MKNKILALMMGVALCSTSPVMGMLDTVDENFDQVKARLMKETGIKKICDNEDGSHDVKITSLAYKEDKNGQQWPTLSTKTEKWFPIDYKTTIPDEAFEAFATTGQYQTEDFLYTTNKEQAAAALKFYRENQNDQGEIAKAYHEEWLKYNNFPSERHPEPWPVDFKYWQSRTAPYDKDVIEYTLCRGRDYSPIAAHHVVVTKELLSH